MIYDFSEMKKQNDELEQELRALKDEYQKPQMTKEQLEKLKLAIKETDMEYTKEHKRTKLAKFTAAAALIAGFLVLPNTSATVAHAMGQIPVIGHLVEAVTFRDYKYDSDRNMADIKIPEIQIKDENADGSLAKQKLEHTTKEINAEIQRITGQLVDEFEENLKDEYGYQDVVVNSEVLATTSDYFTLKLNCYQGAGSGYQWNYYYTIDLSTGERLKLKDIFKEGADYITPISKNIKKQMKEQMEADENVFYWLDHEIEEWNFKSISDDTSFYLNEKDQVVIGFNEGDVAPMYMGTVEFEIPSEVLKTIRK